MNLDGLPFEILREIATGYTDRPLYNLFALCRRITSSLGGLEGSIDLLGQELLKITNYPDPNQGTRRCRKIGNHVFKICALWHQAWQAEICNTKLICFLHNTLENVQRTFCELIDRNQRLFFQGIYSYSAQAEETWLNFIPYSLTCESWIQDESVFKIVEFWRGSWQENSYGEHLSLYLEKPKQNLKEKNLYSSKQPELVWLSLNLNQVTTSIKQSQAIVQLCQVSPAVTELYFNTFKFSDEVMSEIATALPHLKVLHVRGSSALTSAGIQQFTKLRELALLFWEQDGLNVEACQELEVFTLKCCCRNYVINLSNHNSLRELNVKEVDFRNGQQYEVILPNHTLNVTTNKILSFTGQKKTMIKEWRIRQDLSGGIYLSQSVIINKVAIKNCQVEELFLDSFQVDSIFVNDCPKLVKVFLEGKGTSCGSLIISKAPFFIAVQRIEIPSDDPLDKLYPHLESLIVEGTEIDVASTQFKKER